MAAVADTVTVLSLAASSASFTADTVTTPALAVAPAATVSVLFVLKRKSDDAVCKPADAVTVTVVGWLDRCESRAVTVDTPPFSEIDDDDNTSVTDGAASSSSMVSVTADGFATPPPDAAADTDACLSGESVVSVTAVTVTAPALAVDPAAMVSVLALDSVKPAPVAATVNVTASLDLPDSFAVTVETPPVSEIDAGDSASVAVGNDSSSVSVSLAPVTRPIPWSLATVAVTVVERPPLPW